MAVFFSRLSYSLGNEDWETEHRALNLKKDDRVLCVTGSGDRPLHLLLKDCREVVAIDANSIQNHLLSLKICAMQQFDFEQYISFLGVVSSSSRKMQLQKLLPLLDDKSAQYWKQNAHQVSRGILYQGAMEKYTRAMPILARMIQGKSVKRLFNFDHIEEQSQFIDHTWDKMLWRKCFDMILSPKISRLLIRDPGLYAHVDDSIRPGNHLYRQMNNCLKRHLAKDNYLVSFFLRGKVTERASPAYLKEDGVQSIRPRLEKISIKTGNLIHYLETCPEKSFDAFSLSDVASYITKSEFDKLLRGVKRAAKPGARFCFREFLSRRQIPVDLEPHFKRNPALEQKLQDDDRCFVYRFLTGHIE